VASRSGSPTISRSPSRSTTRYDAEGSTAAPSFAGSVHGVVVHTSSDEPTTDGSSAPTIGNRTKTLGSETVS
jgi:hypothetical protein